MYLVVTRTFPPEVGGMQNLLWGLARSLSKLNLTKVFADYNDGYEDGFGAGAESGDVNGDGDLNILDMVVYANYILYP